MYELLANLIAARNLNITQERAMWTNCISGYVKLSLKMRMILNVRLTNSDAMNISILIVFDCRRPRLQSETKGDHWKYIIIIVIAASAIETAYMKFNYEPVASSIFLIRFECFLLCTSKSKRSKSVCV